MRPYAIALIAGCLPLGAYAHQGFASAGNGPTMRITAPIQATTYDGSIRVTVDGKPTLIALATPARLKAKGIPLASLTPGKQVTVDAYDSGGDNSDKLYAKRILVDGRTAVLR